MNLPGRQSGIGITGWMVLILLFGGGLTIGLKLFPVYSDHNTMAGILDGMAAEKGMAAKRNIDIQNIVEQRFKINNIRDFNLKENLKVARDRDGVVVTIDYQVKMPLVHNLELLASFNKSVELQ